MTDYPQRTLACARQVGGYLSELAPLFWPSQVRQRWLVTLAGYFDASGTGPDAQVFVIAGFVSTAERWIAFEPEWRAALAAEDLKDFHMTDYVARQGAYLDWDEDRRRRVLGRLIEIVGRHALLAVASAVTLPAYNRLLPAHAKKAVGNPYTISLSRCTGEVRAWADHYGFTDKMQVFVESGRDGKHEFFGPLSADRRNKPWQRKMGILGFSIVDKHEFPQLQPADILAWEVAAQVREHGNLKGHPRRIGFDAATHVGRRAPHPATRRLGCAQSSPGLDGVQPGPFGAHLAPIV